MPLSNFEKAKKLRDLGILPKSYDFRKTLTKWQKENIAKKTREYKELLIHPERFSIKNIKSDSKKILSKSGYKVTNANKAIIPLKNFESVTIKKGKLIFQSADYDEHVVLSKSADFLKTLKKLMRKKLPNEQMLTVKIGDNAAFGSARFDNYASLYDYLNNVNWKVKKENIWPLISIVIIKRKTKIIQTKGKNKKQINKRGK